MLRLNATTHKLQAKLDAAAATSELHYLVCFSKHTSSGYLGDSQRTTSSGTTEVDICSAPASGEVRDIDYLSVRNRDTAARTITFLGDVSGVNSESLPAFTLAVGDFLQYTHSDGWRVFDSSGRIKGGPFDLGAQPGAPNIAVGSVTVSSSAILIAAARATRRMIILTAQTAHNFYVGPASVTTSIGAVMAASIGAQLILETRADVYAIRPTGATGILAYCEVYD